MKFPSGKKALPEIPARKPLDVVCAEAQYGLSAAEVQRRVDYGYVNTPVMPPTKTVKQIILSNLLTYFNCIFFLLALCIIAVGSWNDLTFMPVVIANIFIGIIQELRSKRTLDRLSILSTPHAVVMRDGEKQTINVHEAVRDDIVIFSAGDQIFADAEVVEYACLVNEALITGEADEIKKRPGDKLLSGSFLVSGKCTARLTAVGADSFVSGLTAEAKKSKGRKQSEMMLSLDRLVKWIGFIIIPLGIILFIKEIVWLDRSVTEGVVSTVGALVGMIPEGLYLLTSIALVAGILRLAKRKTLVHEMGCIETLARVDTLCVDKTGTITEPKMIVEDVALLCPDRFIKDDIRMIMADYVYAMQSDNDTMAALRKYFTGDVNQTAIATLPFSSAKKYGGVSFHEDETYILGAPDVILGADYGKYSDTIDEYSAKGCRVLLLAMYDGTLEDAQLCAPLLPVALILLSNKIRPEAPETFRFFAQQGVAVKVISGDNAMAVSEVAKRAGIKNAARYVDARTLDTDEKIAAAAEKFTVFGRVTPEQKRKLIRAMRAAGHTVAMTGDGVNDVLALKEADCSIAVASGSEVACQVSNIVLLDSNFASLPSVVMEGRRVINNIERAAALYLSKNIFSFLLAVITLIVTLPFPLTPSQMSLVSILMIGYPSFVLALEPNRSIVKGRFLTNVMYRSLPPGLTNLLLILGVLCFYVAFGVPDSEMSTICALIMCVVGILTVYRICTPLTLLRKILLGTIIAGFLLSVFLLDEMFTLVPLSGSSFLVFVVFALLAYPFMIALSRGLDKLTVWLRTHIRLPRRKKES